MEKQASVSKAPALAGIKPLRAAGYFIGALLLAVGMGLGLNTLFTPKAHAAEAIEAPVAVASAVVAQGEEVSEGVAVVENGRKCDVYVASQDLTGLDWAVAKAKEYGCEVRSLFSEDSIEQPLEAAIPAPADETATEEAIN